MVTHPTGKRHLAQRLKPKAPAKVLSMAVITQRRKARAALLDKIEALWEYEHDLRLGQLMVNLHGDAKPDVFYTPDDRLEALIDQKLNHYRSSTDVPDTSIP